MLAPWPRSRGSIAQRLKLVAGPTAEPIGIALVNTALKVQVNEAQFALQTRIATGRRMAEEHIHRKLVQQTWDLFIDDERYVGEGRTFMPFFPMGMYPVQYLEQIKIPFPPTMAVLGMWYRDPNGNEWPIDQSVYAVTAADEPCRIRLRAGQVWPSPTQGFEAFRVRFVCGYAAPLSIAQDGSGMILAQNHGHASGDTISFSGQDGSLPAPLQPHHNYTVTNLTAQGFQVLDAAGNLVSLVNSANWQGTAFVNEIPEPIVQAVAMLSALEKGTAMMSRMAGAAARLSPIELPVEPLELLDQWVFPEL